MVVTLRNTWWVFYRHFNATFVIGHRAEVRWYHAGSWSHKSGVRQIAARLALYFFATLIILTVLSFRFVALWPLIGASSGLRFSCHQSR